MINDEHLATLHPGCAKRVRNWLIACEAAGCPMRITQSQRSREQQAALYAQGRRELEVVNALRALLNLAPLTAEENQRTVTNAAPGQSMHEYGLAADLCYAEGDPYKELGHTLTWEQIGRRAEHAGLVWGGRFKRPDRPHGQWTGTLVEAQVRAGQLPDEPA